MNNYIKDLKDILESLGLGFVVYNDVKLTPDNGVHILMFDKADSLTIGKLKQVKQGINSMNDDQQPRIQWFRDGTHIIIYIPYFA
tara:strand:+ start:409 stop:663 length:255 start_codon:yes stop_codon:yes gene_type:complete